MPNIANLLKQEIARLARKELRTQTEGMKKVSTQNRKYIAELKRQVSRLQRQVSVLEGKVIQDLHAPPAGTDEKPVRFTAKGLRSQRKRLRLSAADYALLVGVTPQTLYKWEREMARPRKEQLIALAALRGMAKREVQVRLEQIGRKQSRRMKKS